MPNVAVVPALERHRLLLEETQAVRSELKREEARLVLELKQVRDALESLPKEPGESAVGFISLRERFRLRQDVTTSGEETTENDEDEQRGPVEHPLLTLSEEIRYDTAPDAIRKVLSMLQRSASGNELLEIMTDSGWRGDSSIMYSALYRMTRRGELNTSGRRGERVYALTTWKEESTRPK